jgi:hypothetical protein
MAESVAYMGDNKQQHYRQASASVRPCRISEEETSTTNLVKQARLFGYRCAAFRLPLRGFSATAARLFGYREKS